MIDSIYSILLQKYKLPYVHTDNVYVWTNNIYSECKDQNGFIYFTEIKNIQVSKKK